LETPVAEGTSTAPATTAENLQLYSRDSINSSKSISSSRVDINKRYHWDIREWQQKKERRRDVSNSGNASNSKERTPAETTTTAEVQGTPTAAIT
jgi:hypothetical protein